MSPNFSIIITNSNEKNLNNRTDQRPAVNAYETIYMPAGSSFIEIARTAASAKGNFIIIAGREPLPTEAMLEEAVCLADPACGTIFLGGDQLGKMEPSAAIEALLKGSLPTASNNYIFRRTLFDKLLTLPGLAELPTTNYEFYVLAALMGISSKIQITGTAYAANPLPPADPAVQATVDYLLWRDFSRDIITDDAREFLRQRIRTNMATLKKNTSDPVNAFKITGIETVIKTALLGLPQPVPKRPLLRKIISLGVKIYKKVTAFKPPKTTDPNLWLLMDQDKRADDNAEHLYRYLVANHPEINAYFALRKTSPDWSRLEREGFRLLDFGGREFMRIHRHASKFISSHADRHIIKFYDNWLSGKKYVFLQHGVIKDDMSGWLNTLPMDLMVTSTTAEYNSVAAPSSPYRLSTDQVVLSGLPRHDALLAPATAPLEKIVLIMPTWRQYLVGSKKRRLSQERRPHPGFKTSQYYQAWLGLLLSRRLQDIAKKNDIKIKFVLHQQMDMYAEDFRKSPFEIINLFGCNIQQLLREASFMITDYSSIAFDMAVLKKMSLYYQFDEIEFFNNHTFKKGYFDYRRDGFGPVCETEDKLLDALENVLGKGSQQPYVERIEKAFPFRDRQNCRRVYEAITDRL